MAAMGRKEFSSPKMKHFMVFCCMECWLRMYWEVSGMVVGVVIDDAIALVRLAD